jgi:hypothetical protein
LGLAAAWSFDVSGSQLVVHVARSGRLSMAFILAADSVEINILHRAQFKPTTGARFVAIKAPQKTSHRV